MRRGNRSEVTKVKVCCSVLRACRGGCSSTAADRERTSESDSAARWRGVAAVCCGRSADAASLLVQERARADLCRTKSQIRPRRYWHAADLRYNADLFFPILLLPVRFHVIVFLLECTNVRGVVRRVQSDVTELN